MANIERNYKDNVFCMLYRDKENLLSGYNAAIMERCESLKGYMAFVNKVRGKTETGESVEKAVTEAVDECIREGVLSGFFHEHRSEVIDMGIYEISDEEYEQVIREESWAAGQAAGQAAGMEIRLIELVRKKVVKGKSLAQTAEELEETEESIRGYYDIIRSAPGKEAEEVLKEAKRDL